MASTTVPTAIVCAYLKAAIKATPAPANIKVQASAQVDYMCALAMKMDYDPRNEDEGDCERGSHPCIALAEYP